MGVMTTTALAAAALAGSAISAKGQMDQGKAASKAMEYNAQVSEIQAQNIEKATELEVWKQERDAARLAGTQRTQYAASGVTPSGTPMQVELESAANAEMDIMITKWNGAVAKLRAKSQSAYDRMLGANYLSAGKTAAAGTLLQGATQFGLSTFGGTAAPKKTSTVTPTPGKISTGGKVK